MELTRIQRHRLSRKLLSQQARLNLLLELLIDMELIESHKRQLLRKLLSQ